MNSITDTQETRPAAPTAGGGLASALGMLGTGLAVVALAAATYLFLELRDARKQIGALSARVGELAAAGDKKTKDLDLGLAAVRGQTAAVAEKAGVTAAELERTAAAARQIRDEQRKGQESLASLDGEVGKVKDDVAASRAAIDQTQAQLQHAIGDLGEQSGLIARNAEELAALERTGLRDYFEFDLGKAKAASLVGPVALRLKDADAKRHKFNMVLVVDDLEIEKRDKTLLEPVQFYRKGSRQLNELVVFSVQKDRITGYLSTIYPVAYPASPAGDGEDPQEALEELNRLAQVTGGRLFQLPNEQALPGVLDEIAADLRAQYVLGFAPDAAGSPGRLRKISVQVPGHGKVVVRHRVGYRLQP